MATRDLEDLTGKTSYNLLWMLSLQSENLTPRRSLSIPGEGCALGRIFFPWTLSRPWPPFHPTASWQNSVHSKILSHLRLFPSRAGTVISKLEVLYKESPTHFSLFRFFFFLSALLKPSRVLNVRTPSGAQLWCYYIVPVKNPTREVGWSASSWSKMFSRRTV